MIRVYTIQLERAMMHSPFSSTPSSLKPAASESIDINEEASVSYWLNALDCSEFDLRMAVAVVGTGAKDVGCELGKAL